MAAKPAAGAGSGMTHSASASSVRQGTPGTPPTSAAPAPPSPKGSPYKAAAPAFAATSLDLEDVFGGGGGAGPSNAQQQQHGGGDDPFAAFDSVDGAAPVEAALAPAAASSSDREPWGFEDHEPGA